MEEIERIDNELKRQFETLTQTVERLEFIEVVEFKLHEAAEKMPWNEIVYSGIYLIEIKNNGQYNNFKTWVDNFKNEWEADRYVKCFTPNIKKMRIQAHTELREWIPLYIGKSKNIGSRIHEHIYKELEKTTFALKLMARQNLAEEMFRLKSIKIDVENYDAIVPRIEWQLRNKINPIIGKQ